MNCDKKDLLLYAVTDRSWLNGRTLYEQVEEALKGGVTFVQLREKNLDDTAFLQEAKEIKELCARYNVPFVINDNIEIAQKAGADGVHVGQDDMPVEEVRKILGEDKIIGVSAHNVEEAVRAEQGGANYLGVGAVHTTATKENTSAVSMEEMKKICQTVSIPVVAIGGIKKNNMNVLSGTGVDGIAVVSAIFAAKNIKEETKELLEAVKEMKAE